MVQLAIALILAGGRGERLWPLSRRNRPKQFASLFDKTLFQMTVERVLPLVTMEGIFVATVESFRREVMHEVPGLVPDQVIIEPMGKNTAPCIGLAALHVLRKNPDEVMLVLPSDHLIEKAHILRETLAFGIDMAGQDHLVTLGIVPACAHTGYGYIYRGTHPVCAKGKMRAYPVRGFTEKPDRETAARYLADGEYFWNSGMFCWKAKMILSEIEKYMPDLHAGLGSIESTLGTPGEQETTRQVFDGLQSQSIDYGVLEHTSRCVVIPTDPGWNDLGSWISMEQVFEQDRSGNSVRGRHLGIETSRCLVDSGKPVITFGLEDIVIVERDDVVFVMPKSRSQEIKKVIRTLEDTPTFRQYLE